MTEPPVAARRMARLLEEARDLLLAAYTLNREHKVLRGLGATHLTMALKKTEGSLKTCEQLGGIERPEGFYGEAG